MNRVQGIGTEDFLPLGWADEEFAFAPPLKRTVAPTVSQTPGHELRRSDMQLQHNFAGWVAPLLHAGPLLQQKHFLLLPILISTWCW